MRKSPSARFLLGATVVILLGFWRLAHAQQPAPPSGQGQKPTVGPPAPQSTHYPILLLIQGAVQGLTQESNLTWSLRVGLKGPERLDRNGYPPIPLEPAEVVREGSRDAWTYHAKDSQTGASITVHLTREPCADPASTSAVKFAFTGTVEHAQIGTLQGCGRVATELFPKINNQPTDDDDDTKDKPAPPTITHFKAPTAVAYISSTGKLVVKRGSIARSIPGKDNYQPCLSHDGRRLLYTTDQKGSENGSGSERTISLYDWGTSKSSELLRGSVQQPFWSPDDTRIAFLKFDGSKWQVWTMPVAEPEKAALLYPSEVVSLQGWADAQTLLVDDLQALSWVGEDGSVKQTLSSGDLYVKDQFGMSSANTVRIHPLNPDLLLVSAELLPPAAASSAKDASNRGATTGAGQAFFLYEIRTKRRVLLSPPNLSSGDAEWSRDGLQIFFTGRDPSNSTTTIYKMFWDGTSQLKVQNGRNPVIGE